MEEFLKINHCNIQSNFRGDEKRGLVSVCDQKDPVFCPKPRRVGVRHQRFQMSQTDAYETMAGAELLDIILRKEEYTPGASSPPFFYGSPPSRAANPLARDARFGDDKLSHVAAFPIPSPSSGLSSPSPSSSSRKGGCVRMKFGLKQAAVRVEGFDCLNRDRQNSGITAVA